MDQGMQQAGAGRLAGKVAVVTGAGSGFGEAIARRFAAEGAAVAVVDLDAARARGVAEAIRAAGGAAQDHCADVADGPSVQRLAQAIDARFGRLDVLVNNAGVGQRYQPADELPEAVFDQLFAVNVKSLYWAGVHWVPLLKRGGGVMLNTASTAALRPRPGNAWYAASKAAVVSATQALALELAPFAVRVCALCPVAGDTPMLARALEGMGDAAAQAQARQQFMGGIPLGRLCAPSDMAQAALFLASDEAAFLTGISLPVDGGRCV